MVDIATSNFSSRNGAKVIWVAIHTTEGIMDADDLGYYWQRITSASSHAGCDNTKTRTYIDPQYASWTLLNGNSKSVNMEICGWAKWTREEWLGAQKGRLIQAANWARQMCDKFGIPKKYIGSAGVARGEAGIIGHVDYTNGAKDGNHWDPGPGFPWDVFIQLVQEGGKSEMSAEDAYNGVASMLKDMAAGRADDLAEALRAVLVHYPVPKINPQGKDDTTTSFHAEVAWLSENFRILANKIDSKQVNVADPKAIAAALVPALVAALPEQLGKFNDEQVKKIAAAVNDELARRQAS